MMDVCSVESGTSLYKLTMTEWQKRWLLGAQAIGLPKNLEYVHGGRFRQIENQLFINWPPHPQSILEPNFEENKKCSTDPLLNPTRNISCFTISENYYYYVTMTHPRVSSATFSLLQSFLFPPQILHQLIILLQR